MRPRERVGQGRRGEGGHERMRREETAGGGGGGGSVGIRGRALPSPTCGQRAEARREAGSATRQRPAGAMEPALDLGLGDSSLHRYLDGEFWRLKNELRRQLGGCPLFRHRYPEPPRSHPAPCAPPAASPRSPRGVPRGRASWGAGAPPLEAGPSRLGR